jgi:hypothetical protein
MEEVKTRCKVYVESVTQKQYCEVLTLGGVAADSEIPEDKRFNNASPSIKMEIMVVNKALWGQFKPGEKFYVDFTPAPE